MKWNKDKEGEKNERYILVNNNNNKNK